MATMAVAIAATAPLMWAQGWGWDPLLLSVLYFLASTPATATVVVGVVVAAAVVVGVVGVCSAGHPEEGEG